MVVDNGRQLRDSKMFRTKRPSLQPVVLRFSNLVKYVPALFPLHDSIARITWSSEHSTCPNSSAFPVLASSSCISVIWQESNQHALKTTTCKYIFIAKVSERKKRHRVSSQTKDGFRFPQRQQHIRSNFHVTESLRHSQRKIIT